MYVSLPDAIKIAYMESLTEVIFPPVQNNVGICKLINLLTLC